MEILIGLLAISMVVSIHEMGHLLAAKACGIQVEVFSIGFGPKLISFVKRNTTYALSLLPLGGYVRMKGEEDMRTAILENKLVIEASAGSFYAAAPWKRIIVAAAGPFMNIIFAIVVFGFMFMPGSHYTSPGNKIIVNSEYAAAFSTDVANNPILFGQDSPAVKAGLHSGDIITTIDGAPVTNFYEVVDEIRTSPSKDKESLVLQIKRNTETFSTTIKPLFNKESGIAQVGISPFEDPVVQSSTGGALQSGLLPGDRILSVNDTVINHSIDLRHAVSKASGPLKLLVSRHDQTIELTAYPDYVQGLPQLDISFQGITITNPPLSIFQAMGKGFTETINTLGTIVNSLKLFGKGLDPTQAVSGPIRTTASIANLITKAYESGWLEIIKVFFLWSAWVSIALFFGNLLPIPALDGGQIVLFIAELIKRKPLTLKTIRRYNTVGLIMVVGLIGFALFGDALFVIKNVGTQVNQ